MILYDRRKPPRSVEVSVSQRIHRGPALIVSLSVSGDGAAALGVVYDGGNTSGVRKATLQCESDASFSPNIRGGIECLTGIHVTVDASTTYVRVEYYPGAEVEDPA